MILSIVVTALLATSNSRFNSDKLRASNNNIPIIYKALEKYLLTNKKLPCPASLREIKSSSTIYGVAASSSDCISTGVYKGTGSGAANLVYVMIPTQTLGLDSKLAEDAYGNKLFYIVDKRLTRTDVALNSFEDVIKNSTLIQVNNDTIELTHSALFIIMSRGSNGLGAFNANSSDIANISIGDETSNDLISINNSTSPPTSNFDNVFIAASVNSSFDDIIFYKTKDQLMEELDAWSLVPCNSYDANETLYCGHNYTWPKAYNGQIVSANEACPAEWNSPQKYPTKKCDKNGVWTQVIDSCSGGSC